MTPLLFWIIAAAVAAVTELATTAFVALYLALGALGAATVAKLGGGIPEQLLAFTVISLVLMALTRPHLKRLLESPDVPMNVHASIGRRGVITSPIRGLGGRGQIRVGSEFWTARLVDEDGVADVDETVRIVAIEGVTAIVEVIDQDAAYTA